MKSAGWNGVQDYDWVGSMLRAQQGRPQYQRAMPSDPGTLSPFQQESLRQFRAERAAEAQAAQEAARTQPAPGAVNNPGNDPRGGLGTAASVAMAPGTGIRGLAGVPGLVSGAVDDFQQGDYGLAGLQAAGAAATGAAAASDVSRLKGSIQAAKGLQASQIPLNTRALAPVASAVPVPATNLAGRMAAQAAKATNYVKNLKPVAAALPAASAVAKWIPGVGGVISTAGNLNAAVTGDQGYMSDSAGGQFAEQALRSAGDVVGNFVNPITGVANTAATVVNAGAQGVRAMGDIVGARESGAQADAYAAKHQGALASRSKWQQFADSETAAGRQADYKSWKGTQAPQAPSTATGAPQKAMQPAASGATHEVR